MRSSVPCSSWIDSFSLLDIQVVSLKGDYYVSLACQVDFVRNNPSRKTRRCWLSEAFGTTRQLKFSLLGTHMISDLVLEPMWMTKQFRGS